MVDNEQGKQNQAVESTTRVDKEKTRQDQVVGLFKEFLQEHGYRRGKALAQLTITLRDLNGARPLQGSGFEVGDAQYIANEGKTGFLQLGKIHSKGPANEGALDFFSRYSHYDASTKFTELVLVFKPDTRQRLITDEEDREQVTQEDWQSIERAGFPVDSVKGFRPASDVLFLVYDPDEEGVKDIAEQYIQHYPELAYLFVPVDEFSDRFSDEGLLPGEEKTDVEFNYVRLISEVLSWYGNIQELANFLLESIFPLLTDDEKARATDVLLEKLTVGTYGPIEQSENIDVLRKIVGQLSDDAFYLYLTLPRRYFRTEQYLPLIYVKYAEQQKPLPDRIREITKESNEIDTYRKLSSVSTLEEWEQIKTDIQNFTYPESFKYFFAQTDNLDIEKKKEVAARRADYGVFIENVFIADMRDKILETKQPTWKFAVRQYLIGLIRPEEGSAAKVEATQVFLQYKYSSKSERERQDAQAVRHDLHMLQHYLGSQWVRGRAQSEWPLEWHEGSLESRLQYAKSLKTKVLPSLAEKLDVLMQYYRDYPKGISRQRSG